MYKGTIKTTSNFNIDVEYDKDKFSLEYVENDNLIILRRLSDNKTLKVFSDKIAFLVQHNIDDSIRFLVSDYSQVEENSKNVSIFSDFFYNDSLNSLIKVCDCDHDNYTLDECRITDNSYFMCKSGYSGYIWNVAKAKSSKSFDRVYIDKNIRDLIDGRSILVRNDIIPFYNGNIKDTITYGIDPETFQVTTPIHSELQQRFIDVYDKEKIKELNSKRLTPIDDDGHSLSDMTIGYEIIRPLEQIAAWSAQFKPDSVYLDVYDEKVNKEYIKQFTKK